MGGLLPWLVAMSLQAQHPRVAAGLTATRSANWQASMATGTPPCSVMMLTTWALPPSMCRAMLWMSILAILVPSWPDASSWFSATVRTPRLLPDRLCSELRDKDSQLKLFQALRRLPRIGISEAL